MVLQKIGHVQQITWHGNTILIILLVGHIMLHVKFTTYIRHRADSFNSDLLQ